MHRLIQGYTQRVVGRGAVFSLLAVSSLASAYLVAEALVPLAGMWETSTATDGQLIFFNSKTDGGEYGLPVEVGDFNGDGMPDLVLAPMAAASGPNEDRQKAGEIYIFRGDRRIDGEVDHGDYTVETFPGLTIWGARALDMLGTEIFTGDVNGDGFDDLLIGAQNYDGPLNDRATCGGVFVILGRPDLLADGGLIDLNYDPASPPPSVITIIGERSGDRLGVWMESGDVDGDGYEDLVIGGDQSAGGIVGGRDRVGMAAIVYGRPDFPQLLDLSIAELPDVSLIYGRDAGDHFGSTIHVIDLDGDGFDEVIISAALNRLSAEQDDIFNGMTTFGESGGGDGPNNDRSEAGETYIFFSDGKSRLPNRLDLARSLSPEITSRLGIVYGALSRSATGEEVEAPDLDGNGKRELVLGGLSATNPSRQIFAGVAYVIYDALLLKGATLDLADPQAPGTPDGLYISEMFGSVRFALFGDTMSVGDFNHDGVDDLAVGFPFTNNEAEPGSVAILFGNEKRLPERFFPDNVTPEDDVLLMLVRGTDGEDKFSYSMEVVDYDGDGYDDLFPNAMHGHGFQNNSFVAGEAYVISGFHLTGERFEISEIVPTSQTVGSSATVTISGCGFTTNDDTRVFVGDVEATSIDILSGSKLTAVFPASETPATLPVHVDSVHGTATLADAFSYVDAAPFVRGDSDGSGGINITDPIITLAHLFRDRPALCLDRHDTNDDGTIDLTDAVATLEFLFRQGAPPMEPYPTPGLDPTPDNLQPCVVP